MHPPESLVSRLLAQQSQQPKGAQIYMAASEDPLNPSASRGSTLRNNNHGDTQESNISQPPMIISIHQQLSHLAQSLGRLEGLLLATIAPPQRQDMVDSKSRFGKKNRVSHKIPQEKESQVIGIVPDLGKSQHPSIPFHSAPERSVTSPKHFYHGSKSKNTWNAYGEGSDLD